MRFPPATLRSEGSLPALQSLSLLQQSSNQGSRPIAQSDLHPGFFPLQPGSPVRTRTGALSAMSRMFGSPRSRASSRGAEDATYCDLRFTLLSLSLACMSRLSHSFNRFSVCSWYKGKASAEKTSKALRKTVIAWARRSTAFGPSA